MSIEVERGFRNGAWAPAAVREFVAGVVRQWACEQVAEDACLLANELVTNAVLHAGTDVVVRMSLDEGVLFLEVEDGSLDMPEPLPLTPDSDRGRGLFLIEALSDSWGAERSPRGKVVWFNLTVREAVAPGATDAKAAPDSARAGSAHRRRIAV